MLLQSTLRVLAVALALCAGGLAQAGQLSKEEQVRKAEEVRAFFRANGIEKSKQAFEDKAGTWQSPDFEIAVQNGVTGVLEIHSTQPQYTGVDNRDLKDADGKEFVKELLAIPDTGWLEFKFPNPATGKIQNGRIYVIREGDYAIAVSSYAE
jgi:cytochrome c